MENKEIVKQMIDFQKKSFDNCFSAMIMIQDQTEKLLKTFIGQSLMNDESKKVLDQWTDVYKKSRDDFKKAIDEGYSEAESFFDKNAMVMFQDQTKKLFNAFFNPKK
jgi:hypothetical protein